MKILIVGAGEVGFNIAARLVAEGHDVVIIDRDETVLNRAVEALDMQGLRGHGARPSVLEEAGIAEAGMLVAVTDSDEVNMVACLTAAILGRRDVIKVARLRDQSYLDPRIIGHDRVAIDLAINPERVSADKILSLLRYPEVTEMIEFAHGRVQLLGIEVAPTSPLAGMRLLDLPERILSAELLVAAIRREGKAIIPRGADVILPGDELYLVAPVDEVENVLRAAGVQVLPITRVAIFGGTKIGRFLAEDLSGMGMRPKLFEADPRLARWLSEQLPDVVVVNGSPTDATLLQEENIGEMQAVIACGRAEEVNVMSALLARRMGARRIIATTNRTDYQPLIKSIGFDVCISPRLMAVSSIMHFIRRGRVVAVQALGDDDQAEALEFEAQLTSEAVGIPLSALRLPPGVLIAALIRGEVVLVPRGSTVIEEGDHVLVVCRTAVIPDVERILQRRVDRGA
ncbi:MAG: Trk system potassium transporter TrkA [Myxococcales bacterium]|nr:Trk system potassium transporter TrkA [Myxococcales bacterium]